MSPWTKAHQAIQQERDRQWLAVVDYRLKAGPVRIKTYAPGDAGRYQAANKFLCDYLTEHHIGINDCNMEYFIP